VSIRYIASDDGVLGWLGDWVHRYNREGVHENTIGRWLHEPGLTRFQPRPVHPQKDPEAEETFKKFHRPDQSRIPKRLAGY